MFSHINSPDDQGEQASQSGLDQAASGYGLFPLQQASKELRDQVGREIEALKPKHLEKEFWSYGYQEPCPPLCQSIKDVGFRSREDNMKGFDWFPLLTICRIPGFLS